MPSHHGEKASAVRVAQLFIAIAAGSQLDRILGHLGLAARRRVDGEPGECDKAAEDRQAPFDPPEGNANASDDDDSFDGRHCVHDRFADGYAAVRSVFDVLRTRSRRLVIDRWDPLIVLTRVGETNDQVCETQEDESQREVDEAIDQQGRSSSEPHHGPSCSIKSPSIWTTLILDD